MEYLIEMWQNNESFRIIILVLFPCIICYILYKLYCWTSNKDYSKKEAFITAAFLTPITMIMIGGLFLLLLTIIYNL